MVKDVQFQLINPKYELPPKSNQLNLFGESDKSDSYFCIAQLSECVELKVVAYYDFNFKTWKSETPSVRQIKYWLKPIE